jgi:hypothetical protein
MDEPWNPYRYAAEFKAEARVEALKNFGIWPGIVRRRDGTFSLTYDPGDLAVLDGKGYAA